MNATHAGATLAFLLAVAPASAQNVKITPVGSGTGKGDILLFSCVASMDRDRRQYATYSESLVGQHLLSVINRGNAQIEVFH